MNYSLLKFLPLSFVRYKKITIKVHKTLKQKQNHILARNKNHKYGAYLKRVPRGWLVGLKRNTFSIKTHSSV